MTMSTMSWGVKSPASQALVYPPFPLPWRPAALGTLKGNQPKCLDSGLLATSPPFPVIPPARRCGAVARAELRGLGSAPRAVGLGPALCLCK